MLNQLRWRIAIPYIILIAVIMVAVAFYLSNEVRKNELSKLDSNAYSNALIISNFIGSSEKDLSPAEDELDNLVKEWSKSINSRVTIIDKEGVVIAESDADRMTMDNHLDRPEIQQAITDGVGRSVRFSRTEGIEFMYVAVPVLETGDFIGFARVAIPLSQIQADINLLNRTLFLAAVIAALVAILIAAIIAELLSRPLRDLTEAIQHVTVENFNLDLVPSSDNEIRQLTRAFDTVFNHFEHQFIELEYKRLKLRTVLDQISDSIVIADDEGSLQMINPATAKIFGIDNEQVIGQSIVKVLREHQIVSLWRSASQKREIQSMEIDLRSKDLSLLAHAFPLEEPFVGSIMLVFQDVTHLQHLETVRRDFISNISHELRTPLASLKSLAETLQDGALDDPPAARHFLTRIETEVDALSLMVQELLELSRIESGKVPLNLESISPLELIHSAVERLKLQIERSELTVRIDCPDDIPLVLGDYPRLEQVIVNLLHNSIKFTPAGGKLYLSAIQDVDFIVFSIEDTGSGIPDKDLPRIFERFYKVDQSRSKGGTGLGLAISKHIIEAHYGKIWVESIEGRGSKFFFSLPISA